MKTDLPNEFQKYWHTEPKEWHENKIGIYHVSSIGVDHQDLNPSEHSGPCLRETFYEYTDPLPQSDGTKGNFEMGNDIHEKLQKIIKEWKPNSIIEKPLIKLLKNKGRLIKIVGSIDVEYQHRCEEDPTKPIKISIWDIKSASDWTLPKGKYDRNPTHFAQVTIYAVMDELYSLNERWNVIVRVKIIYVNKHNKGTHTQRIKHDHIKAMGKWANFVSRVFYLDECLASDILPDREPHKWCKFCKYRNRCRADVKHNANIPQYDEDELKAMFKNETTKNAIWNGKETKGFIEWKGKM